MMREALFWKVIDSSRQRALETKRRPLQDFLDVHEQTLADALRQLPPTEIVAFEERFSYYLDLAYRWDLWAAAYWLYGGCSDDAFLDCRSCLISLGKALFFQVLKDPDSLADIVGRPDSQYILAEGFQYVASRVYQEKTGTYIPQGVGYGPKEPAGSRIDHDDKEVMRKHFPKIVAKFPDMGD